MKKNRSKLLSLLILSVSFFCGSCSQEDEISSGKYEGDPVKLNVVLGGTEDFSSGPISRSGDVGLEKYMNIECDSLSGLYVETTVERVAAERKVETRANLNDNSRFRMIVSDVDGFLVQTYDYIVKGTTVSLAEGSTAPILEPGIYKFICMTKNSSASDPFLATNATVDNGEDFGVYVETKAISSSSNTLTISFKRKIAQLSIEIVGSGFNNNTPNIDANGIIVNNLNTSARWSSSPSDTNDKEFDVINTSSASMKVTQGVPFLVIPINNKDLTVSIPELQFDGKTYLNLKATMKGISLARNANYKLTVKFKKNTSGGIEYNGLVWAPGNLKYENGVYGFMPSQEANTKDSEHIDLFKPYDTKTTDLCSKVAPAGTWRMPSSNEMYEICSGSHAFGTLNGVPGFYYGKNKEIFLHAIEPNYNGSYILNSKSKRYNSDYYYPFLIQFSKDKISALFFEHKEISAPKMHIRCIKGPEKTYPNVLELSSTVINIGSGETTFSIKAVEAYDIVGYLPGANFPDWLLTHGVVPNDHFDLVHTFTAEANTTGACRTTTITFFSTTMSKTVTITQAK